MKKFFLFVAVVAMLVGFSPVGAFELFQQTVRTINFGPVSTATFGVNTQDDKCNDAYRYTDDVSPAIWVSYVHGIPMTFNVEDLAPNDADNVCTLNRGRNKPLP